MHSTKSLELPHTVRDRVSLLFAHSKISPQKGSVLMYMLSHPNALTHEIARGGGTSYPPSTFKKLEGPLREVGLRIEKIRPALPTDQCRWRLTMMAP